MKFIEDVRASIYNPDYYKELLKKPFSHSLKYFFFLALCFAFVGALLSLFTFLPGLNTFLRELGPKVLAHYPQDLVITIKDGVASTNVAEPYIVKFPQEYAEEAKKNGLDVENLFVIDTKHNATLDLFASYKTFALLLRQSVMYRDKNGKITVQPLDKVRDFKLDKDVISSWLGKAEPYFKYAAPILTLGIFFLFFLGIALNLLYLVGIALLIWFVAAMKKIKIGYGKAYQLGLHLVTAGIILNAIFALAPLQYQIPYLFLIVTVAAAVVNLKRLEAQTNGEPPIAPQTTT